MCDGAMDQIRDDLAVLRRDFAAIADDVRGPLREGVAGEPATREAEKGLLYKVDKLLQLANGGAGGVTVKPTKRQGVAAGSIALVAATLSQVIAHYLPT